MTTKPTASRRQRSAARAWLVVLLCYDLAAAAIAAQVWTAQRNGSLAAADAAALDLWGVSAAAGAVIALLALIGTRPGRVGSGLSTASWVLAWLRILTLPVAVPLIAAIAGVEAITGLDDILIIVLTLAEAAALLMAVAASRRAVGPPGTASTR